MTQTSPKSADQNTTNGYNPNLPTNDHISSHTTQSVEEFISDAKTLKSVTPPELKPKQSPESFWQHLIRGWENLTFRTKLTIILIAGAAVPVIAVTQGLTSLSQGSARAALEETLRSEESGFVNDYLLRLKGESQWQANTIAETVQAAGIDLQQPTQVNSNIPLLQALVTKMMAVQDSTHPDFYKSFRIITNVQGKTVAQYIQTHADYPLDASPKNGEIIKPVSVPIGIDLGDVPIIKDALRTGRNLTGVELLEGKFLQRLGLDKQASVSLQSQPTQGLPEAKQPFPEGTYPDVAKGRTGLVAMAVQPIKVQGKVVGAAVVGSLLNKSHSVVDAFSKTYSNLGVTLFARDLRVSTTIPYRGSKSRATGTRASREVAEAVLNQGKEFFGQTNIIGKDYLTAYNPLYDHQKELNPAQAKPVGMAFLGTSLEEAQNTTANAQLLGYGIGGGILLLVGLVTIPIAGSFARPLRRLVGFAQKVGAGEQGVRLETTERQDEIGVLSQELNQMVARLEDNLEVSHQEAERVKLFADVAASRVRGVQDLESVFNRAVQGAKRLLYADRVVIYRFNANWSGYIAAESVDPGWPRALGDKIEDPCIGEGLIEAYKKGRVVPTDNVFEAGFHPDHMKLLERLEVKANLVTPIVSNDQLFGLLIAHHCSNPYSWQQSEINFLVQLSAQVGLSLDRVSFLDQQKTAKEQLQRRALELLMEVDPVSRGDLTIRANVTEDEIGTVADSYNATINSLRKIVTQVQAAATQVVTTTSSSEVSVQELSVEALRQAEEIATALDQIQEMSDSIRAVSANAEQAEAAVQQATQTVEAGDAAMNRTVDGILAIRETVAETSKKVKRLGESSQKISKVVNLIGTFADKNKLTGAQCCD